MGDVFSRYDQLRFILRSRLRSAADISGMQPLVFRQLLFHVLEQREVKVPERFVEILLLGVVLVPLVHVFNDLFRAWHDAACQGIHWSYAANRQGSCPLAFGPFRIIP